MNVHEGDICIYDDLQGVIYNFLKFARYVNKITRGCMRYI